MTDARKKRFCHKDRVKIGQFCGSFEISKERKKQKKSAKAEVDEEVDMEVSIGKIECNGP